MVSNLQLFPTWRKTYPIAAPKIYPYNKDKVKIAIYLPLTLVGVISTKIVAANLKINHNINDNKFYIKK